MVDNVMISIEGTEKGLGKLKSIINAKNLGRVEY